ncbi:MAG TPA: c-type cytochrome [Terriglobia bacterium]|nr:c-type cytochrome [Terriglobia bacterium]
MIRKFTLLLPLLIAFFLVLWTACTGGRTTSEYAVRTGGDPQRGREIIMKFDCGSCHVIPGVRHAIGTVGPPLTQIARRTMIAGEVPNTPANMVRWIQSPRSIEPGTAMPDLGLSEQQARDVAAYLYTLR